MNFWNTIRIDLQRAFCSKLFLIGILCTAGICCLNCSWDNMGDSVVNNIAQLIFGSYVQMVFLCGAIPYSAAYLSDLEHGYINALVVRSSLRSYLYSKAAVAAVSGFAAVFFGKLLFALILLSGYPLVSSNNCSDQGLELLIQISPWLYIAADAAVSAVSAAGFAVMALVVSSVIRSTFVTIMSPLVLYFMISSICQLINIPDVINISAMTYGTISMWYDNGVMTLVHIVLVWTIVAVLTGKLFVHHAERRFYDG